MTNPFLIALVEMYFKNKLWRSLASIILQLIEEHLLCKMFVVSSKSLKTSLTLKKKTQVGSYVIFLKRKSIETSCNDMSIQRCFTFYQFLFFNLQFKYNSV